MRIPSPSWSSSFVVGRLFFIKNYLNLFIVNCLLLTVYCG